MKKRKILIKLLILLVIVIMINLIQQYTIASSETTAVVQNQQSSIFGDITALDIGDGLAGLLMWLARIILVVLGATIGVILKLFSGDGGGITLSIEDILFNKIEVTSIDFFGDTSAGTVTDLIRKNVATWYVGIRNLSAVILVLILIYVAIRMAMSTISKDKAKYKTMLVDWLTSICILLVLNYIMIIVIRLNNVFVELISGALEKTSGGWDEEKMVLSALAPFASLSKGMGYAFIYVMLEGMTLLFLVAYIKRMLTIAFLIIIAPLITITYSIDKIGDGKSQALNNWLKEFIYNVVIQPFQCITYIALCSIAFDILDVGSLTASFLAVILLTFLWEAEKIIKEIFHIKAKSLNDTIAQAAIATQLISGAGKVGNLIGSAKNGIQEVKDILGKKSGNNNENGLTDSNDSQDNNDNQNNRESEDNNTDEGDSNSNNTKNKKGNIAGKALKKYIRANIRAAGALAGLATGASVGKISTSLIGAKTGGSIGGEVADDMLVKDQQRELARAFNNYKNATGKDEKEIVKDGVEFLDGTKRAETEEERDYRNQLLKMKRTYKKTGKNEEDSYKNTKKVAEQISKGLIGESTGRIFFGKIKNRNNANNGGDQNS